MITVYSQSLLEVQSWFKTCETNSKRGILYLLITELLISSTTHLLSMTSNAQPLFEAQDYKAVRVALKLKYRGMATAEMWVEADRFFAALLDSRKHLPDQFMRELINAGHHGVELAYNAKDLVMCTYRIRQPADDVIDNLALRSIGCVS